LVLFVRDQNSDTRDLMRRMDVIVIEADDNAIGINVCEFFTHY
jgi:hypothetical protein